MTHNEHVLERIDDIVRSEEDTRTYRGLLLRNRMRVLLISDAHTDQSAAALGVNIGYMSDPWDIPGLAHFCEHMLLLATEKYPSDNAYQKFVWDHGGFCNAFTYTDNTVYVFHVLPEHLANALDHFVQFFIAPLFSVSMTERELSAVDGEAEKNVQVDRCRIDQLLGHTARAGHPCGKFGTGNRHTLQAAPLERGVNVRDALLMFYNTWYSANIMCLTVLGCEPMDDLEALVVNLFKDVVNKNVEIPDWSGQQPYTADEMKTCLKVVPVKDTRGLYVYFPCMDTQEYYQSGPEWYLENLLGHEGPGSILEALKQEGWASALNAYYDCPFRDTAFMVVSVTLTAEGLTHTDDIIVYIFQYINMLKQNPPSEDFHNELRQIEDIDFRFMDRTAPYHYVYELTQNLSKVPFRDILSHDYLLTAWRPDVITQILDAMCVDNIRVVIVSQEFQAIAQQTEPWYGTRYALEPIPEAVLKRWRNAGLNPVLHMPIANTFIPEDLRLYYVPEDTPEWPLVIRDTEYMRVWFKQDDDYYYPKLCFLCQLYTPLVQLDALNYNLCVLFGMLVIDALGPLIYPAELTGIDWDFTTNVDGFYLWITGYDDKLHLVLEVIAKMIFTLVIDEKRFDMCKDQYVRDLKNFDADQPHQQATYFLRYLLSEVFWTRHECLTAMANVNKDTLEAFMPQLFSKIFCEYLIYGNTHQQMALKMVKIMQNYLSAASPISPQLRQGHREIELNPGKGYLYTRTNSVHTTSAACVYYQCGVQTTRSNVMLELFAHIADEPFYDDLRTKQQLGYLIFCNVRRTSGSAQGLALVLQSSHDPLYVDERIEAFLLDFIVSLEQMSDEEFGKHIGALAGKRSERPNRLRSACHLLWTEIRQKTYQFNRDDVEVECLRCVTREDFAQVCREWFHAQSTQRRKLSVHVVSALKSRGNLVDGGGQEVIVSNVDHFKTMHGFYPGVKD